MKMSFLSWTERMIAPDLSNKDKVTLALFKVLSGSVRFRILVLLRTHSKGLSVGDIAEILDGSVSRISHQLSILKKMNLVTGTGTDHHVLYALNDKKIESLVDSLCAAHKELRHGS